MAQNTIQLDIIVGEHGRGALATDAAADALTVHGITPLRVAAAEANYRGQLGYTTPPAAMGTLYAAMKEIEHLYTGGPAALG
ncbi:hypothetical protein HYV82_04060 [Candidatus Woesearchaeota archaeon]|nr:hypothetical protein [Candidatus Woesearchaeota archaeon]